MSIETDIRKHLSVIEKELMLIRYSLEKIARHAAPLSSEAVSE